MLTALSIRDIVLIEALDLDFRGGLGVLTGETGAGKSILLDSVGLALGARADSGLVRAGADRGSVAASFDLRRMPGGLSALLDDNEIAIEKGEPLLLRRNLRADGGSKAFINDQPCSAALLREVGAFLVEIHGQHDDRGLINPAGHRALLDSYSGEGTDAVRAAWKEWQALRDRLETARNALDEAERNREWLAHAVDELTAFAPQPGEEAELAGERADMQKGERLAGDLQAVSDVFEGSDGGLAQLRGAARRLDRMAEEHALLVEALAALDRALIEAGEAEEKLAEVTEALSFDPERLDAVERRLFELRALARKHDVAPDALADLRAKLEGELEDLARGGASIATLEQSERDARDAYMHKADALHACRLDAAKRLDEAVAGELAPLKLDAARFRTDVRKLSEERWGPSGYDAVEFLIATNIGADFAPLGKIASGGELSRFILSLKVALAEKGGAGTIIFDEIDRGVGGAVASAIGERLARLSEGKQLLVVTHSPQVAARGKHHYVIAKSSDGTVTRTGVTELDEDGRRHEIARMLSGAEITDEARAQADRLLEGV